VVGVTGATGVIGAIGGAPSEYLYWSGSAWVVGTSDVRLGANAGALSARANGVAIGVTAGFQNATGCINAIAIGNAAGTTNQKDRTVAIGFSAGNNAQQPNAVAIGYDAGANTQGDSGIAIGNNAGRNSQTSNAIAIGNLAGYNYQGGNAIAIGNQAGTTTSHAGSIILNASGAELNSQQVDSLFVKPVRANAATTQILGYDTTTGEVTYRAGPGLFAQNNAYANWPRVTDTTVNTEIFNTLGVVGTTTLPANSITSGSCYQCIMTGRIFNGWSGSGTQTVTFSFQFGTTSTTTVCTIPAQSFTYPSGVIFYKITGIFTFVTGATQNVFSNIQFQSTNGVNLIVSNDGFGLTVDKAVTNVFGVKAQLSASSGNQTFYVQCQQGVFMKLM